MQNSTAKRYINHFIGTQVPLHNSTLESEIATQDNFMREVEKYMTYKISMVITHTVDTEFSVTNFFCLHFSEHAQWRLPVMSDILVKIFVDISCNICGLFLL